jgi:hypothetical protein
MRAPHAAPQINPHQLLVPRQILNFLEQRMRRAAGVVDQRIDAAKAPRRQRSAPALRLHRHVGRHHQRLRATAAHSAATCSSSSALRAASTSATPCHAARQLPRDFCADAIRAPVMMMTCIDLLCWSNYSKITAFCLTLWSKHAFPASPSLPASPCKPTPSNHRRRRSAAARSPVLLADDLLEGRGTGQRGGDLTVRYLETQAAVLGLKPLADGTTASW